MRMTDEESNEQNRRRASTPSSSTPRKPTVCTNCRQSKVSHDAVQSSSSFPFTENSSRLQVRCIGSENDSCDRCRRLQVECNRDPGFKRVSKTRYVVLQGSLHWLTGLFSKIAELEKQVQLLASAVNRSQPANTPQNQPAISIPAPQTPRFYSDNLIGPNIDSQSSTWQGSREPERRPELSTTNVVSSFPPMLDALDSINQFNFQQNDLLRPRAVVPRSLETLQLSTGQIDDLFQV